MKDIEPYKSDDIPAPDTTAVAAEETTFPIKVRVVMEADGGWSDELLAWIKAHQNKVVTGKMVCWDEFRPDGVPLILYADEYEVVESTTNGRTAPSLPVRCHNPHLRLHARRFPPSFSPVLSSSTRNGLVSTSPSWGMTPRRKRSLEEPEDMYKIRFDNGTEITAWATKSASSMIATVSEIERSGARQAILPCPSPSA